MKVTTLLLLQLYVFAVDSYNLLPCPTDVRSDRRRGHLWKNRQLLPTLTRPSLPLAATPGESPSEPTSSAAVNYDPQASPDYIDRGSYWVYMYFLLMVYQQREGHTDVPFRHIEQGWHLGGWLSDQRHLYQRGILEPSRQRRLEAAGVAWNLHDRHWDTMVQLLVDFSNRHGHANVPQHYRTEQGHKLGTWLNTQRAAYRHGKMARERQALLEDLGVAWNQQHAKWNHMYTLLKQFRVREGHARVSLHHIEQGEKLGTWLASQRKFLKAGSLREDRQQRLADVGVINVPQSPPSK